LSLFSTVSSKVASVISKAILLNLNCYAKVVNFYSKAYSESISFSNERIGNFYMYMAGSSAPSFAEAMEEASHRAFRYNSSPQAKDM
jgi:hypothetical protein